MWIKIKYRRSFLVLCIITATIFTLVHCVSNNDKKITEAQPPGFDDYVKSSECAGCHKDIYDQHIQTAHFLSANPADQQYIKGSFSPDSNSYWYTPSILLKMEKRDSGFYQVVYFKGQKKKEMRFDIVIGSGVMGQSFLSWRGNQLYQLPITFFTAANQWSNSPGFPSDRVLIDRPITSRCLECHTSFAMGVAGPPLEPTDFDRNRIIFGIDCQNCHGPAARHVAFHTNNPNEKTARFIINPSALSRSRQLDVCAVCHGGNIQKIKPSFEFTAGKNLADYFTIDTLSNVMLNGSNIDVHGNQVGLLMASKCFTSSVTMTCSSCHNTHQNERGRKDVFSQRCISCHNTASPTFQTSTHTQINNIDKNCIDCHMPAQPSRSIAVLLEGEETPKASLLRSHLIGIYPEADKEALKNYINKK